MPQTNHYINNEFQSKAQIPHLVSPLTTSDLRGKLPVCRKCLEEAALSGGEEIQWR